jgi:hypothetical protein
MSACHRSAAASTSSRRTSSALDPRAAGVPTGWEVVTDLIDRVAQLEVKRAVNAYLVTLPIW